MTPHPKRLARLAAAGCLAFRMAAMGSSAVAQTPPPSSPLPAPAPAPPAAAASPVNAPLPTGYALLGPLRLRDLTPYHLTRLEMMPAEASAALGGGWMLETDLTHTNDFARSVAAGRYLLFRDARLPISERDAQAILGAHGDTFLFSGEIGELATTVHYQAGRRLGVFLTLPFYYYSNGLFDRLIDDYHNAFGFPNNGRPLVAANDFAVIYRVGHEQVVELQPPPSGLSDPIAGLRYRLLPLDSPWDLIASGAVKVAIHQAGSLSTGGSDVAVQLALHRFFRRQAAYLDLSVVRVGGALPDAGVDRRTIPAGTLAYELGLAHHLSFVLQYYLSKSVFTHSNVADLIENKNEVIGGFRFQHGSAAWTFAVIENLVHYENTPDVGAQLGFTWNLGGGGRIGSAGAAAATASSPGQDKDPRIAGGNVEGARFDH